MGTRSEFDRPAAFGAIRLAPTPAYEQDETVDAVMSSARVIEGLAPPVVREVEWGGWEDDLPTVIDWECFDPSNLG